MTSECRSKVPGWFVGLAVVVTAAVTVWAMSKRRAGESILDTVKDTPQSPVVAAVDPQSFQRVAAQRQAPAAAPAATPTATAGVQPGQVSRRCACPTGGAVAKAATPSPKSTATTTATPPNGAQRSAPVALSTMQQQSTRRPAATAATRGGAGGTVAGLRTGSSAAAAGGAGSLQTTRAATPRAGANNQRVRPQTKWLGMDVRPIARVNGATLGVPPGVRGLVVTEVEGAAAAAGIQRGDVLLSIDGAAVRDPAAFSRATLAGTRKRGTVGVLRNGRFVSVAVGGATGAASPSAARSGGGVRIRPTTTRRSTAATTNAGAQAGRPNPL